MLVFGNQKHVVFVLSLFFYWAFCFEVILNGYGENVDLCGRTNIFQHTQPEWNLLTLRELHAQTRPGINDSVAYCKLLEKVCPVCLVCLCVRRN